MNDQLQVSLVMRMVDQFSNKTGRINTAMNKVGSNGQRAMGALRKSTNLAAAGLDKLGNRYTAMIGGASAGLALRNVIALDTRLARLGVQAGKSSDEIDKLHKKMLSVANDKNIRIDPTGVLDAVDQIVEKTGNLDLAVSNIKNIGLAIQATGAAGSDVGAMVADMYEKFGIKDPKELNKTLDLLVNQGKAGAFTLADLATQGNRVTAAYSRTNRRGTGAASEMGALLQVARKGSGSAEQTATALEAIITNLTDLKKRKILESNGIKLFDPDSPKVMRSLVDIMKEIVVMSKGDAGVLNSLFGAEGGRGVSFLAAEYNQTGGFKTLDDFQKVSSDGSTLTNDSAAVASRSGAKLQVVKNSVQNGLFSNLQTPLDAVTGGVNSFDGDQANSAGDLLIKGAGLLGGAILARKAYTGGRKLFGKKSALGSVASAVGGIGSSRVFVVNWPRQMGGHGVGFGGEGGRKARGGKSSRLGRAAGRLGRFGKFGKIAKLGKGFGKAVPFLGTGLAVADIGMAAMSSEPDAMGEAIGSAGGALAGAAAGALIGSVVPVLGTAIGAAIGGVIGSFGGGYIGEKISGQINVKVDSEGRSTVNAQMDNPNIGTQIDQGILMGGGL